MKKSKMLSILSLSGLTLLASSYATAQSNFIFRADLIGGTSAATFVDETTMAEYPFDTTPIGGGLRLGRMYRDWGTVSMGTVLRLAYLPSEKEDYTNLKYSTDAYAALMQRFNYKMDGGITPYASIGIGGLRRKLEQGTTYTGTFFESGLSFAAGVEYEATNGLVFGVDASATYGSPFTLAASIGWNF